MTADAPISSSKSQAPLPQWYPAWSKELAGLYFSGTINAFVLYGNVHGWDDLKRVFFHYEPPALTTAVPSPAEGVVPPPKDGGV